jgi:RNA polymerase sigma-70 factor (ECF subfamily)
MHDRVSRDPDTEVDTNPKLRLISPPSPEAPGADASPADGREGGALESRGDDDLMLLARGGVGAAFEALVRRHQARMLRVAARYLGRPSLAPDVVQNTFLEVYKGLPRYQARGRFGSYVYRVLLNQCRMAGRSAKHESRALDQVAEQATDGGKATDEEILTRERQRDLDRAVGRLSDKLRSVVLLRYTAGFDYAKIAATLDVPLGTVKRRMFDALKVLQESLEEEA